MKPPHQARGGRARARAAAAEVSPTASVPATQGVAALGGQLEAIFASMADGVVFFDGEGRFVGANPAYRGLVALDRRPDYGSLSLPERGRLLMPRDDQGRALPEDEWLSCCVLRGEVLTGADAVDFMIRALDGREILVNGSGSPVRDGDGRIVGGMLILRDVTERARLERRTRQALDPLLVMEETLVSDDLDPAFPSEPTTIGMAQRLAELTRTVLGCERVIIVPLRPGDEVQETVGIAGPVADEEGRRWRADWPRPRFLRDLLPAALIARLERGERIAVDRREPPFNRWPNPLGSRSMLLVPMFLRTHLVGMLTTDRGPDRHAFSPDELALAAGAARLAALVLERNRTRYVSRRCGYGLGGTLSPRPAADLRVRRGAGFRPAPGPPRLGAAAGPVVVAA